MKIIYTLTFFLLVGSAFAQNKLPTCKGNNQQQWNSCTGTIKADDGSAYEGDFANGQMDGYGLLTLPSGEKVLGQFKKSVLSGRGLLVAKDGSRYAGEFDQNIFNGQGISVMADGERIEGIFRNGQFVEAKKVTDAQILALLAAPPVFTSVTILTGKADLAEYEKTTSQNQEGKSNQNTQKNQTTNSSEQSNSTPQQYDNKYSGFKDKSGILECQGPNPSSWNNCAGKSQPSDGAYEYIGEFKSGLFDGVGQIKFKNGDAYYAQFRDGEVHGFGIHVSAIGDVFVGFFSRNMYDGSGKLLRKVSGKVEEGFWQKNKFINSEKPGPRNVPRDDFIKKWSQLFGKKVDRQIRIVNNSKLSIGGIYFAGEKDDDWGKNNLEKGQQLNSKESAKVTVMIDDLSETPVAQYLNTPCLYDVKVKYSNGRIEEQPVVNLCNSSSGSVTTFNGQKSKPELNQNTLQLARRLNHFFSQQNFQQIAALLKQNPECGVGSGVAKIRRTDWTLEFNNNISSLLIANDPEKVGYGTVLGVVRNDSIGKVNDVLNLSYHCVAN